MLILSAILLFPAPAPLAKPPSPFPWALASKEEASGLRRTREYAKFRALLKWLEGTHVSKRISLATCLLPGMLTQPGQEAHAIDFEDEFVQVKGTHDLNTEAGRSAHAIERLLACRFSVVVTKNTSREQLETLHTEAAKEIDSLVTRVGEAEAQNKDTPSVEELAKRYRGRIIPLPKKAAPGAGRFCGQLFEEWNPIGKKLSDLETILGVKTYSRKLNEHHFDVGIGLEGMPGSLFMQYYTIHTDANGRIRAILVY